MFGNFGMQEILLILVVALLLFGAKRLPEIGGSLGKGIREFKKSIRDVEGDVKGEISGGPDQERARQEQPDDAARRD